MSIKDEIRSMAKALDIYVTKELRIFTCQDTETRELVKHCIDIPKLHSYLKQICSNKGISVVNVDIEPNDYKGVDKTEAWKYSKTYEPFDHQAAYFNLSKDKEFFANFSEMGLGKTIMEIMTAGYLYDTGEIEALVIVCPNGLNRLWVNEAIPEHLIDEVNPLCGIWSSKNKKKYKDYMERFVDLEHKGIKVLSMNVEALGSGTGKAYEYIYNFMEKHNCLLVIDESTRIKNHKAKRTKAILQLGKLAKYRRILSGLYVVNGPLDLFSQFYFLDPQILGYNSYVAFRSRYAIEHNPKLKADLAVALESKALGEKVYNERLQRFVSPGRLQALLPEDTPDHVLQNVWKILKKSFLFIVDYKNIDELSVRIKDHSFRVLKEECLDLPDKLYQQYEVELSIGQKRIYKELEESLITEINDMELIASHVLTKLGLLRQITGGTYRSEDEECHVIGGKIPRLEKLIEVINDIDKERKIIIWCCYRGEISMIIKRLEEEFGEESYAQIHGGITGDAREDDVNRFRANKECRFLVGTQASGGIGRTLVESNFMVYYSNSFSLEDRRQSEMRIDRIGQTRNTTIIDFFTKDLIDHQVFKALMNKQSISDQITKDRFCWKPLGD